MSGMLQNVPLFAGLSAEGVRVLCAIARTRQYPKNATVISEGEDSDSLYIVNKGRVKVTLGDADGKEVIISLLGAGEYFGELALIDDECRSARVITAEPSEFFVISKPDFRGLLAQHPDLAMNLLKGLARRLRAADQKIGSLALMDVYRRVTSYLRDNAVAEDGQLVVNERLTQTDIAHMVGASREMVSRIFNALTEGGYIAVEGKKIRLLKKLPASW